MIERNFPLQQGDLDYFCSIYAVINLLHSKGAVADLAAAGESFTLLINEIDRVKGGSVAATATEGTDGEDVIWFFKKLKFKAVEIKNPSAPEIVKSAQKGAIIFLRTTDTEFDHYTVVAADSEEGRLGLLDSYGFDAILRDGDGWTLNGKSIEILNLYVLV